MKKQLLKFGKALSKAEQRNVFGGNIQEGQTCELYYYDKNGNLTTTISYGGFSPGSIGSREANDSCVAAIDVGSTANCSYDCEYDGWGN